MDRKRPRYSLYKRIRRRVPLHIDARFSGASDRVRFWRRKMEIFFQTAGVPLVARTINTRQSSTSRSPAHRPKTTPIEWKVEGRRRELGPKEGTHPIQTATASRHNAQLCETSVIMPRRPTKLNLPGACPSSITRVSRCRMPRPTQAWSCDPFPGDLGSFQRMREYRLAIVRLGVSIPALPRKDSSGFEEETFG